MHEIFDRSTTDEKHQLMGYVFSNLELEGAKLRYALKAPFNLLQNMPEIEKWLPFVESYRTLCIIPDQAMQHVFQSMKGQSVGFAV